jgi:hypothetical protein
MKYSVQSLCQISPFRVINSKLTEDSIAEPRSTKQTEIDVHFELRCIGAFSVGLMYSGTIPSLDRFVLLPWENMISLTLKMNSISRSRCASKHFAATDEFLQCLQSLFKFYWLTRTTRNNSHLFMNKMANGVRVDGQLLSICSVRLKF